MAASRLSLFVLVFLAFGVFKGNTKTIIIDPNQGEDTHECLTGEDQNLPCRTLLFAYYGRNLSRSDEFYERRTQPAESASSNVEYVIRSGVLRHPTPLLVINSTNVTFRAEADRQSIIRCTQFPNFGNSSGFGPNETYRSDDIAVTDSRMIRFEGLVFEQCGPANSALFFFRAHNIEIINCTFRGITGCAIQFRFCDDVAIVSTTFEENRSERDRTIDFGNSTVDVERFLDLVLLGGAVTYIHEDKKEVSLRIMQSRFVDNSAYPNTLFSRPVLLRENGHGGGILLCIAGIENSTFAIEESEFRNNHADVDGGGVYISSLCGSGQNKHNTIVLRELTFVNNTVSEAGGGAISFNSFQISYNNKIDIIDSRFESNNASAGGAVSFVLYQSDPDLPPDNLVFRNCVFVENTAENDGTAVGLFSLLHVDEFGFPVWFQDCIFENNLSTDQNLDTSALAASRFPITLNGSNVFRNNSGGAITLLNTQMDAFGEVVMDRNTAAFGGGLAMDDRCLLNLHPGVVMNLTNNHATMFGGGIYLQLPALRFIIQYFNRLCFVQFNAEGLADVPPEEWDASVNFINNSAGESGAAIFASDFFGCSWLGNTQTDLIFRPNVTASPFYYENNRLLPSGSFTKSEELGSRALNLFADVFKSRSSVQPGEVVFINITVTDQLGNRKEGLLSVSGPRYNDITAFGGNDDPYIFRVPALSVLRDKLSENFTGDFDVNITMSLLRSVGLPVNITLTIVVDCHPGYHLVDDLCVLSSSTPGILEASRNNRHVIITEGMYAWPDSHNRLVVSNVPPGYIQCTRRIGLQGCFAKFDNLDQQCLPSRKGVLCGDCAEEDYGISLSLSECSSSCTAGQVLFVILCVAVVVVSFLIMFFNVQVPNELKGFLFYAQVIGLVYQQFESSNRRQEINGTLGNAEVKFMSNILSSSLPIPFCFHPSWDTHWVTLLSFVPSILVFATVVAYAIAARRLSCLGKRTSLGGIALLLLFIYKYVADTSFVLISCFQTNDNQFRFFYNGSKLCSDADYLPFYIISWVLLIGVFTAPFFLAIIPYKFYGKFKHFSDVLTNGLHSKYRWWGGWDLGRRFVFVLVSFFGLITIPYLVLFFQQLVALLIFIMHCFLKPYSEMHVNVIEALILFDFVVLIALFNTNYHRFQLPIWFTFVLMVLPFVYCVLFIIWKLFMQFWSKVMKKEPITFQELFKYFFGKCFSRHHSSVSTEVDEHIRYSDYSPPVAKRPVHGRQPSDAINSDDDVVDKFRVPTFDDS